MLKRQEFEQVEDLSEESKQEESKQTPSPDHDLEKNQQTLIFHQRKLAQALEVSKRHKPSLNQSSSQSQSCEEPQEPPGEHLLRERMEIGFNLLDNIEHESTLPIDASIFWREQLLCNKLGSVSRTAAELISINHLINAGWKILKYNSKSRIVVAQSPSKETFQILNLIQLPQRTFCFQTERDLQNQLIKAISASKGIQQSRFPLGILLRCALSDAQIPHLLESLKSQIEEWIENHCTSTELSPEPLIIKEASFSQDAKAPKDVISQQSCRLYPYTNNYKFNKSILEIWPIKQVHRAPDVDPLIAYVHSHTIGSSLLERIELLLNTDKIQKNNSTPMLVSLVSFENQRISDSNWRHFFFGPSKERVSEGYICDANQFRGWFQNPMNEHVAGFMFLTSSARKQNTHRTREYQCSSFLNKSEEYSLSPKDLFPTTGLYTVKKIKHDPLVAKIKLQSS